MIAKWWDNLQESCDMRLGVGAGCAVAWVLILAVSPVVSSAPTLFAIEQNWRLAAVIAAAAGCACLHLFSRRQHEVRGDALIIPLMASGAVLALVSAAVLHFSDTGPLSLAAGIGIGWSLVSLAVGWMAPFASLSLRKRVVGTVTAAFIGCFAYLAICLLPFPLSFAVALALVPLSCGLRCALGAHSPAPDDASPIQSDAERAADFAPGSRTPRTLGRELSLATFVYGALFVLAGHVLPELESEWMASALPGIVNVTAFLLLETLITLYMVRRIRHENPRVAYRPSTILVAASFLLVPFCDAALAIGCSAIAFAGFGSFLIYLWIVAGNFCQKWHTSDISVAASTFFVLFAGLLFGEALSWAILQLRNPGFDYLAALSIVALFMLAVLMWSMSNGARYAHETVEMGGRPYGEQTGDTPSRAQDAQPDDGQILQALAESYGLSPRETEIVALLVKGRSIPYICDELFIAKSTAQTHVRHIYGKMEITGGRQELLDRFEDKAASLAETPTD